MVRLVVSDVDGTLLRNGQKTIPEEIIEIIKSLKERGIMFAVASGREYSNLRDLFEPVKKDIIYICVNGALVVYDDKLISKTPLERKTAFSIADEIYKANGCEMLISGEEKTYAKVKSYDYADHVRKNIGNILEEIRNIRDVRENIIKISAYKKSGITKEAEMFIKKWGDKVQVVQSQDTWVDFTAPMVTKGAALYMVQEAFGFSYDETMTFGDNYNDLDMFAQSFFSYAISDSAPDIRNSARFLAPDVATILMDVLRI